MQMSRSPAQSFLNRTPESPERADRPSKVAVLGIGHELRGDDAVGIVVARGLEPLAASRDWLLVIDAGPVPENFIGTLRRFKPDLVLLVDAAQLDERPGSVRWVDWRDTVALTTSTHTLPLTVLCSYLVSELGCEVAILGIQPTCTVIGASLSLSVRRAAHSIVRALVDMLP
jgi:hydrogenase 3 maturation protease